MKSMNALETVQVKNELLSKVKTEIQFTKNMPLEDLFDISDHLTMEPAEAIQFLLQELVEERRQHQITKEQSQKYKSLAFTSTVAKVDNLNRLQESFPSLIQKQSHKTPFPLIRHQELIVMLDMDGFKKVNDTYGHDTGDSLLEYTGRCLTNNVRINQDFVYHLHGDEFAIVFTNCTTEEIQTICNRIIEELKRPFLLNGQSINSNGVKIGFSYGIGFTLEQADEKLYEDKRRKDRKVKFA